MAKMGRGWTLLTTKQAATQLGISAKTLARWRKEHRGPAFVEYTPGQGGTVKYDPRALARWLEERTYQPREGSE